MVRKNGLHNKIRICLIFLLLSAICLTGCDKSKAKRLVLTTGFEKDELFKIEDESCLLPEALIYLYNQIDSYVLVYGPNILDIEVDGVRLSESLKDNVLSDISQIKAMNIAAKKQGITLDEESQKRVLAAAEKYYDSLNQKEIEKTGITKKILEQMYYEYALAGKYYAEIISDINPEISDDEARTITVLQIFIKTYTTDGSGAKIEYSYDSRMDAYDKACMILEKVKNGEEDFETIAEEYTEGDSIEYSFCKGEMDINFENAAFNLGKDEVSEVITTPYGFHIIKCLNTFNREETDLNKIRIADEQRKMVFEEQYESFAKTLLTYFNDKLWESVEASYDEEITTTGFLDYYNTDNYE